MPELHAAETQKLDRLVSGPRAVVVAEATAVFREMDASGWLEKAEAKLHALSGDSGAHRAALP